MTTQIYEKNITIAINDWENAMELTKQKELSKQLKYELHCLILHVSGGQIY